MKLSKEVLSSCLGFVAFLLVLYSPKAGFQNSQYIIGLAFLFALSGYILIMRKYKEPITLMIANCLMIGLLFFGISVLLRSTASA